MPQRNLNLKSLLPIPSLPRKGFCRRFESQTARSIRKWASESLRKTIEIADKYGKLVISGAGFPQWETVQKAKALGVKAIELGYDVSILRAVWSKTIQEMRKGL